jgi:hypothetical protein
MIQPLAASHAVAASWGDGESGKRKFAARQLGKVQVGVVDACLVPVEQSRSVSADADVGGSGVAVRSAGGRPGVPTLGGNRQPHPAAARTGPRRRRGLW